MLTKPFRIQITAIIVAIICLGIVVSAQESTPEATPEATPESTAEFTPEATDDPALCPALVQTALDLTEFNCDGTSVNEACYGYIRLDAEPRAGLDSFDFTAPGDTVQLIDVQSLQLSAMDVSSGQWGVMVMRVEANVAETAQSPEDVQLLLFGDTNLGDASRWVQVTATTDVNIRAFPDTSAEVLQILPAGESIVANARLDDDSWLRVRVSDEASGLGWIATEFIEATSDIEVMTALTPEEAMLPEDDVRSSFGPMQAFYFESGTDDSPCSEAPNSGMLIQTPDGVASVTIWLDEVVIQMSGTGYVQAEAGGELTLNVLEGSAQVEANGESRTAVAGQAVSVELNEELGAVSVPSAPVPINPEDVQALPVQLLDTAVTVPAPLTTTGVPTAGQWAFSFGVSSMTCPDGTNVDFTSSGVPANITVQTDGISLSGLRYAQQTSGVYRATYTDGDGSLHQDTLRVVASDQIIGEKVLDLANPICTLNVPFSLRLLSVP